MLSLPNTENRNVITNLRGQDNVLQKKKMTASRSSLYQRLVMKCINLVLSEVLQVWLDGGMHIQAVYAETDRQVHLLTHKQNSAVT